jgi:hypothetical protein
VEIQQGNGPPARMVVRESIYHEILRRGARPMVYEPVPRSYGLTTDEQAWQGSITVSSEWVAIPKKWIDKCSMLIIEHEEGNTLTRRPTMDQLDEMSLKIVEVAKFEEVFAEVRPGDPALRLRPYNLDYASFRLRCQHGTTSVRVYLMPV